MKKKAEIQKVRQVDQDIDQAIQKVYQEYGPDLSMFFSEIQTKLEQENKKNSSGKFNLIHKNG
jgi:hypothetical protein